MLVSNFPPKKAKGYFSLDTLFSKITFHHRGTGDTEKSIFCRAGHRACLIDRSTRWPTLRTWCQFVAPSFTGGAALCRQLMPALQSTKRSFRAAPKGAPLPGDV